MKKPTIVSGLSILFLYLILAPAALFASSTDNSNADLNARSINGYLLLVGVSVNGAGPYDFLVDTGTNTTLVDPSLAAELKLKPVDRMALTTLADATPVVRYYADRLQAGPAAVSHLELLGAPLTELRAVDNRIRGVLGMNFLLQFSFMLDYRHHRMEIFPFPDSAPVPEGIRLQVQINDSRILVPVISQSSPRGAWNLVLDSGISQFLVFQSRMRVAKQPCEQAPCVMNVATNASTYSALSVVIPEMAIAETRLLNQPAVLIRNELLNPSDPQDGLLPASLFRSVFFDRTDGTLVVETR